MLARWVAGIAIAVGLAGCGDPERDILPAGSTAVVVDKEGALMLDERGEQTYQRVAPGTRVTVGHDPGYLQDTVEKHNRYIDKLVEEADGDAEKIQRAEAFRKRGPPRSEHNDIMGGYRYVKVMIETGKHSGSAVSIMRKAMRAVE